MSFTVIIPARYQASRFPGKLLALLDGITVLEHSWRRANQSKADEVVIAVDDQRLAEAAEGFGANVYMTSSELASGTDRVHQAAIMFGCDSERVIVNLQGDEPLFDSVDINRVAQALIDAPGYHMASMMHPFANTADVDNPNMVKVVCADDGKALYFSRSVIPSGRDEASRHFRHLGIYAYRMDFLDDFVRWPVSELERSERLEQLRALSNGASIKMIESQHQGHRGIDTPEDLDIVANLLAERHR